MKIKSGKDKNSHEVFRKVEVDLSTGEGTTKLGKKMTDGGRKTRMGTSPGEKAMTNPNVLTPRELLNHGSSVGPLIATRGCQRFKNWEEQESKD